jgi:hypothetical protein
MHLFGLNRRRSETFLLAIGQLVLIAYIFQFAAFDHWHTNPATDVTGVVGSSAHSTLHSDHCHGAASSCADAGGGFAQVSADQTVRLPTSTPSLVLDTDAGTSAPQDALIAAPTEPPRAAA